MGFTGDGKSSCDDIDECAEDLDNCHENADCMNTEGSFTCVCKEGFSGDGIMSCIDVTNCTMNWDVQRSRWIGKNDDWKNVTRNCDGLGDDLPDPMVDTTDPPIQQWLVLLENFNASLNAWLKAASDLSIPGIPSSIAFNETNPDKLWEQIKFYQNHFNDLWYEHVGKPNGLVKPDPFGQCDNKRVEEWVRSNSVSDTASEDFEDVFDGRCDAR
jgi:hypothetical protein